MKESHRMARLARKPLTLGGSMWRLRMGGVGTQWWMARLLAVSTAVLALVAVSAAQPASESDLAKETQNPVSELISVPFESNFNFGVGPNHDLQYILNV